MHYIIVEPIEGYTSQERAETISQELFNVGRPLDVRHPNDVSTSVFGTVQHPDTGVHALSVDLEYEIYVHPENNLTQLLLLFPEVTEEEKTQLAAYIKSNVTNRFPFGNIIPSTATARDWDEMNALGWFQQEDI